MKLPIRLIQELRNLDLDWDVHDLADGTEVNLRQYSPSDLIGWLIFGEYSVRIAQVSVSNGYLHITSCLTHGN